MYRFSRRLCCVENRLVEIAGQSQVHNSRPAWRATHQAESPTPFSIRWSCDHCAVPVETDLRKAMSSRRALSELLLQGVRSRAACRTGAGAGELKARANISAFNDAIRAASNCPEFVNFSDDSRDQDVVATRGKVVDLLAPYHRGVKTGLYGAATGVRKPVLMNEFVNGFSWASSCTSFAAAAGEFPRAGNAEVKGLNLGTDVIKGQRKFKASAILSNISSKRNRPMSPHLTVYRPERSSMSSITNRITGALLSVILAGGVLVVKVADTSLSFYPVYSLVFFSQQIPHWLTLSVANFALVSLLYHVFHSLRRELQQWGVIKFKI